MPYRNFVDVLHSILSDTAAQEGLLCNYPQYEYNAIIGLLRKIDEPVVNMLVKYLIANGVTADEVIALLKRILRSKEHGCNQQHSRHFSFHDR